MLQLNQQGFVLSSKVKIAQRPLIERATLKRISGIIVHQTGGANAASSLSSYAKADATGAHFLIDRDGTVFQTASLFRQTWHVGRLRARCLAEYRCTPTELRALSKFNPKAEHRREMAKTVPQRYPANEDSIGIEIVGSVRTPNGKPAEVGVYEAVSPQQNQSLKWLVTELSSTFSIPMTEVFRHPFVSRKNPTEAASALW
jgi:N-acetyl-anhydromuramyl-L-alanine amidase AmpD